jgi:Tfp pilus assembly protein PilE
METALVKINGITSTAIVSLLLGIAIPAYSWQEQQNEKQDHPEQKQTKPEQKTKLEPQHAQEQQQRSQNQQHAEQPQQQEQQNQNKQHAQQQEQQNQNNHYAQQHQPTQQQQRVEQSTWQEHRARSWQSDHRDWQQRGGYHGYRIPDDRYHGYFGPDHSFRIYGLPFMVVGGYPRFQYEGYWFTAVDPWPEDWANNWYDTDDVYVTYVNNGYYLFNSRYPNVGIAVSISM